MQRVFRKIGKRSVFMQLFIESIVCSSLYKTIDNTRRGWPHGYGKPLEIVIGKKFQWAALEMCVSSMHVDEVCIQIGEDKQKGALFLVESIRHKTRVDGAVSGRLEKATRHCARRRRSLECGERRSRRRR